MNTSACQSFFLTITEMSREVFCDSPPELNNVKFWKADGSMITLSSGPYMLVYTELTTVTLSLTIHSLSLEGTNV